MVQPGRLMFLLISILYFLSLFRAIYVIFLPTSTPTYATKNILGIFPFLVINEFPSITCRNLFRRQFTMLDFLGPRRHVSFNNMPILSLHERIRRAVEATRQVSNFFPEKNKKLKIFRRRLLLELFWKAAAG